MKTIILNGSPRKNWNTALMLKEAQKGAESVGAETEYIDLFDLTYTGCRSCLACKRKDAEHCKCFWKDDLSPIIERIFAADALIIGSPIYLGDITSQVHGLIERLQFCALSYDNYSNYFTGCIWAYCESGPKWEIRVFLFKFLEVSENQIPHRKLHELSVGEHSLPPFRRLRGL